MEYSHEKSHEQPRKSVEWDSDSATTGFENFAKRYISEVLQQTRTVQRDDLTIRYNTGISIVYLLHLKFGIENKDQNATLSRDVDPDMVSPPLHKVKIKLTEAYKTSPNTIPSGYTVVGALHALEKFDELQFGNLEKVKIEESDLTSRRTELLLELESCIKTDFCWLLESQWASILLGRETWMIEPNHVNTFTAYEEDLNTSLFLKLQTGTITGQARRCFQDATHGSFLQAWSDLHREFGTSNIRQKFKHVYALFSLGQKGKDMTAFEQEILITCTNLVAANVTLIDLMKYAILEALDQNDSI